MILSIGTKVGFFFFFQSCRTTYQLSIQTFCVFKVAEIHEDDPVGSTNPLLADRSNPGAGFHAGPKISFIIEKGVIAIDSTNPTSTIFLPKEIHLCRALI